MTQRGKHRFIFWAIAAAWTILLCFPGVLHAQLTHHKVETDDGFLVVKPEVIFSRADTEDSNGNKYGYDEMDADPNDDHVSVEKDNSTFVKVTLTGISDASCIKFVSRDESIVKVEVPGATPAAGFKLKLLGQTKDKAETQVDARIRTNTGPIVATINANVYKKIMLLSDYFLVYKSGDNSTKPSVVNETDITNKANEYLKFSVVEININPPTEKAIAFDKNGNGKVDFYKNGPNPEIDEIYNTSGAGYKDIVLLKDSFPRNWYISSSVKDNDTTITANIDNATASGLITQTNTYSIGKPDGTDKETFIIVSIAGNTLTIDTDPGTSGNQGFTKAHPLTTDPKTSHTIVDEDSKTVGLGSNQTLNKPALVVGATANEVGYYVAHEHMHGQVLSDVNEPGNLMHYEVNPIGNLPLRFKELVEVITGTPDPKSGNPKDNQWDDLTR